MVLRASAAVLVFAALLSGCANRIQNKEKVQEAIINRLQTNSGLDVNSLDISTTSVTFDKDMAYATVAFHPKGATGLNNGMTMKYTLQARDGKWAVVAVGDSQGQGQGHGPPGSGSGASLPPGHPPVGSAMNPPASGMPGQSTNAPSAHGRTQ